jgi:hypothetical protein
LKKKSDQESKMGPSEIDEILARIRAQMNLDRETEHEVLEEIRSHLGEVVAEAQSQGADEAKALAQAAARFGVEEVGTTLQAVHAGWGTADAVIAAGLPVVCALVLRWLVFAPDGTNLGWQQVLVRPAFWIVALAALLVPPLKFERWRYALVAWGFFWVMTVIFALSSAVRW